jgi:hypothetical protein
MTKLFQFKKKRTFMALNYIYLSSPYSLSSPLSSFTESEPTTYPNLKTTTTKYNINNLLLKMQIKRVSYRTKSREKFLFFSKKKQQQ